MREWEWRESGVELALERALPTGADATPLLASDPGRSNPPLDAQAAQTHLVAFELPLDGLSGSPDTPRPFAAICATSANWSGAALYADRGDGQLLPFGPSGRTRATIGTAQSALPAASPLFFDRASELVVSLVDPTMQLASVDTRQLADGANLALIGEEIVQFLTATPLGEGRWRLAGLLRGVGGTEAATGGHSADEPFVLLDARLKPLDATVLGTEPGRQVVALGRGDSEPVAAPILLDRVTLRPLAPVHPRKSQNDVGGWTLSWTRRARGGWAWQDGVDVPLVEQAERYVVTLGPIDAPFATWTTDAPALEIDAGLLATLTALAPGAALRVRQQGTHALSLPLLLCTLP